MEKRVFGNTGAAVPVIGQGTWQMETENGEWTVRSLRAGLDLGLTHVDTAELYGDGHVEQMVGTAIQGRRDEVFLVSKVMPSNASRKGTVAACERSLKRLRTDRLDCYLLHWPGSHPLAETVAAFEELVEDGKIRSWGVSNFAVDELEDLLLIAGKGRIACNQVLYHLEERAIEHAVIPWCQAQGVAVVAYSPFGNGNFPSPKSAGGKVLADIAKAHGATPYQVALQFLVRHPSLFAIPKASDPKHVKDNAEAVSLKLTEAELKRIDEAFPRGDEPASLPSL
jgi:diketogulonate reductase-like aldo/keto reductase